MPWNPAHFHLWNCFCSLRNKTTKHNWLHGSPGRRTLIGYAKHFGYICYAVAHYAHLVELGGRYGQGVYGLCDSGLATGCTFGTTFQNTKRRKMNERCTEHRRARPLAHPPGAFVSASESRSSGTGCSESGPKVADGIVQISNSRSVAPAAEFRNENFLKRRKGAMFGLWCASMPSTFLGRATREL